MTVPSPPSLPPSLPPTHLSQETSIDSHLAVEPSINIRHNTADAAALLDSQEVAEGEEGLEEADEDTITSFDDEIFTKVLFSLPGQGFECV